MHNVFLYDAVIETARQGQADL